jgi:pyruvate dehydrogenase E1 component beta subunit
MKIKENYGTAIKSGFEYLLKNYPEVFVIGQGLWSPWYVGNTMQDLDKNFGVARIIDTPVSESAVTGFAVGASLAGSKPIVVHPRIDFMLYAMDSIVNQAAKWSHMTGGQAHPSLTIRAIINRGGEQGAQHSQSLHSWFSHIPGLKVVMPSSVKDARDMLIASVLSKDPVIYIDDRWLYDQEDELEPIIEKNLNDFKPILKSSGKDLTIAASSYSVLLGEKVSEKLKKDGVSVDLIDVRTLNPFDSSLIIKSVKKTKKLLVIDGGWKNSGFSSEIITSVMENIDPSILEKSPKRITLPDAPAPSSSELEKIYYPTVDKIYKEIRSNFL